MINPLVRPDQIAVVGRPVPLWRNRDFLLLWSGQIVSTLGSQVSLVAFPLLMLAATGSPAWAGVLGALRGLPFVVLALPAGALVDRWDRKRLMIGCDIGRALALGSIPLALVTGGVTIPHLALVTLVEGTLFTFFNIAETTCLPRVVAREQLPAAVARDQASLAAAELVGPSLGGALYGVSMALPFLADAVSYLASAVSLRFIRANLQAERTTEAVDRRLDRLWAEIGEGLVWLWRQPALRVIALLTSGLNLFSFGYVLIIIVIAQGLGATPAEIGLIFASGGAGGIGGALLAGRLQRHVQVGPLMLGATWVWALTWPLYVITPNLVILGIVNALGFIVVPVYMTTQYSYRLSLIPDPLQGRVNSAFRLLSYGVQPLSLALTGGLLEAFGPVATVWIITTPQVLMAVAVSFYTPLRRAKR